jgi:hypothetical protein
MTAARSPENGEIAVHSIVVGFRLNFGQMTCRMRARRSLDAATDLAAKEQHMVEQIDSVFDYVVVGGGLAGAQLLRA